MFMVFAYISYKDYQNRLETRFGQLSQSIKHTIGSEETRIVALYRSRLIKNLKSYGVIEAFKNQNREKLFKLIKPRYDELKKENEHFINMHFHNKDNSSFLRMHKPEKYGDDLSSFRNIVVDINKEKNFLHGFEKGRYGYFYRIILPIAQNKEHLGSVEFGLTLGYFTQNLQRLMPYTKFGLLFNDNNKNKKEYELIIDNENFFKPVMNKLDLSKDFQVLDIDKKTYIISSNIYIKDYKGNNAIKMLFAVDITEYKKQLRNEFLFLLFLGALTYSISFLIINGGFKKYITSITSQSKKLKEYTSIIDDYVVVSSTDLKGNITYASDAFCKISGYSKNELIGKSHSLIRHPDMEDATFKQMWETIKDQKVWSGEVKNKKKDGGYYWVHAVISPVYDEDGKVKGYTAIRNDISDKKLIEEISQKDKLTQIFNRLKLDDELAMELEKSRRYNIPFSIILLDIDKFKSVNDTYGHQAGDSVLIQMSQILSKNIRKIDILGRWGGEEFMIICPNTTAENCKILAEHLREKIEKFTFDSVSKSTASFGVTQYKQNEDEKKLLKRCDDALYEAKNNGRNRVVTK